MAEVRRSVRRRGRVPRGGQRFEPEYVVVDGCHACERLATMRVGFDFAADGTLEGSVPLDVAALPR